MNVETAQMAIEFIKRVQLNVQEMQAMQQVISALAELAELTDPPKPSLSLVDPSTGREGTG